MENRFYTEFDTETWEARRPLTPDRSPFEIDRDRILYSAAFRRLQAKTQVFQAGEYDFYRTRLTHSLEVAHIGRSICGHLLRLGEPLAPDFFIDPDLVEAACLAHDIGHPPYGHAGERALHELMRPHGGFEGNAQTLRILTDLMFGGAPIRRGMRPTRALIDAVMKYKRPYDPAQAPNNHFLYPEQTAQLEFVAPAGPDGPASIECQIMDWADDTAYSLMDIVDGCAAGFIRSDAVERWAANHSPDPTASAALDYLLQALHDDAVERRFARRIGDLIHACSLSPRQGASPATHRHAFDLVVEPAARARAKIYSRLAVDLVFRAPQLQQLEFKGARILRDLFGAFAEQYLQERSPAVRLLPPQTETLLIAQEPQSARARVLCDHIAGMTDGFAVRTHRRLFDPAFGSIADIT
ncbi:MAG TPA: dNTP triphosphohydrolase [Verrucomicrobiae bacterium]|nr:dNTP triphosphohydrolase [Verrucomicrobiae bacterium]